MKASIRRRLEMVGRVRDFLRTNPVEDPSHTALVARLEETYGRAQTLMVEEARCGFWNAWA